METTPEKPQRIDNKQAISLAYRYVAGDPSQPALVFLGGYRSDMQGTKALHLDKWARKNNISYLRLDYSGHGDSEGRFEDGTIGSWLEDALTVIDHATSGPLILAGSSMGGWLALLVATIHPERVKALVGVAAAPDFTKWVWDSLTKEQRERCKRDGFITEDSAYSEEPDLMTYNLFEDGKNHLVLDKPIPFTNPVILLQGKQDMEVPWQMAQHIADRLQPDQTKIIYIEDGDHRLSRDEDLNLLEKTVSDCFFSG